MSPSTSELTLAAKGHGMLRSERFQSYDQQRFERRHAPPPSVLARGRAASVPLCAICPEEERRRRESTRFGDHDTVRRYDAQGPGRSSTSGAVTMVPSRVGADEYLYCRSGSRAYVVETECLEIVDMGVGTIDEVGPIDEEVAISIEPDRGQVGIGKPVRRWNSIVMGSNEAEDVDMREWKSKTTATSTLGVGVKRTRSQRWSESAGNFWRQVKRKFSGSRAAKGGDSGYVSSSDSDDEEEVNGYRERHATTTVNSRSANSNWRSLAKLRASRAGSSEAIVDVTPPTRSRRSGTSIVPGVFRRRWTESPSRNVERQSSINTGFVTAAAGHTPVGPAIDPIYLQSDSQSSPSRPSYIEGQLDVPQDLSDQSCLDHSLVDTRDMYAKHLIKTLNLWLDRDQCLNSERDARYCSFPGNMTSPEVQQRASELHQVEVEKKLLETITQFRRMQESANRGIGETRSRGRTIDGRRSSSYESSSVWRMETENILMAITAR